MAAGTSSDDRFEQVDWDQVANSRIGFSRVQLGRILTFGGILALLLYDYFVVTGRDPTVNVGAFVWNATQLDWLFLTTILAGVWYAVVPLALNRRLTLHYWSQFKKNRAAVVSLLYLLVIFAVGTVGPLVFAKPELQILQAYQPPVFTSVNSNIPPQCVGQTYEATVAAEGGGTRAARFCQGTWKHPLGTTQQGKDILMLMVFGMRVSMQVGLITTLILILIGTAIGTLAAYSGGYVDEVLMRYVDVQLSFPEFPLYLLLVYLFGGSLFLLIMIFGLLGWGGIARLVRSEALQRTEEEYITAAKASGGSTLYVLRRHVVPNVSNTVITAATLTIPGLILAEAGLSFIGLGDPSIPSWGQVISNGRSDLATAWWVSTVPGVFLFMTIMAFNFLGDALRDSLDPRHKGGGE